MFAALTSKLKPVTLRRWRAFFSQYRARIGLAVIGFIFLVSMSAPVWSHSRPLYLKRTVEGESRTFFPAFANYPVSDFGITDTFIVDFKEMVKKDKEEGKDTVAVFPLNVWDPFTQTSEILAPPSKTHYLGTDNLGRDVVARLIYGLRVSLGFGLLYWLFSFISGILIGSVQGYFGGWVDFAIERVAELVSTLPTLAIVILVNGMTKTQSFLSTLFIVLLFAWLGIASQNRAQFLSLRKREFCEAARSMGASHGRVIFKHIFPNALTPILTLTPFQISAGISTLAVLDFLGYGMSPPTPSIGELLAQGRAYITNAPWLLIVPTISLIIVLLSINMVGEAVREAFDPKRS